MGEKFDDAFHSRSNHFWRISDQTEDEDTGTPKRVRNHRRSRLGLIAATVATVAIVLTGCSKSGSDASGSSTQGSSGTTSSADIAAAKSATAENEKELTSIGALTPLTSKPEPGKTFVWMACDFPVCKFQTDGAQAAAEAAGWDFQSVNYSLSDPASIVNGLKQALQYKPYAVGVGSLQEAQFASVIPAYEEAGAVIVNAYSNGEPTGPIISNYNGPGLAVDQGQRFANWFIADSEGAGKGLIAEISEVGTLKATTDETQKYVAEHCPGCSLKPVPVSIADASSGKLASVVTSALLKDPSINYVIIPEASFAAGLSSALQAAGIADKVKVAAQGGTGPDIAAMKQGKFAALTQSNLATDGWRAVDGALRHEQGLPQPAEDVFVPTRLLTKDTPNLQEQDVLLEPADYADQFKKLWLLNN